VTFITICALLQTWLRQPQQYFFIQNENNKDQDWNIHGRYCATESKNTKGNFGRPALIKQIKVNS
jgi:hypothetical protein